ncbi:hypothetical protein [Plantactinospora veratri]
MAPRTARSMVLSSLKSARIGSPGPAARAGGAAPVAITAVASNTVPIRLFHMAASSLRVRILAIGE